MMSESTKGSPGKLYKRTLYIGRSRRRLEDAVKRFMYAWRAQAMSDAIAKSISNPDRLRKFQKNSQTLAASQPAVLQPFWKLHKAAVSPGALDTKSKELIALAISVALRCDDCVAHHTHDALEAGATREEIADALGVAILMAGGTGVVYASHAIEAVDQFLEHAG